MITGKNHIGNQLSAEGSKTFKTFDPISNIENSSITSVNGDLSIDQVEKAIKKACVTKGWRATIKSPGHITATLNVRSHVAIVDIDYNPQSFSITYKDSTNLKYDGENIHRSYNNWIVYLERAIISQLLMY